VAADEFKVSPDPDLVEKIRDIVGLYLNPPVAAAVFAVDEKPQIQALDRSAPILPMLPTTPQRATHDYERNGTIDLFAALEVATGKVITQQRPSHTSAEFVVFLNKINREVPAGLDVHVVLDNLSTHNAQPTAPSMTSPPIFAAGPRPGTTTPNRSPGTSPQTTSCNASPATAQQSTKCDLFNPDRTLGVCQPRQQAALRPAAANGLGAQSRPVEHRQTDDAVARGAAIAKCRYRRRDSDPLR
jgi:DDE superfamily endonuclease